VALSYESRELVASEVGQQNLGKTCIKRQVQLLELVGREKRPVVQRQAAEALVSRTQAA
jgi:hypothetical protein